MTEVHHTVVRYTVNVRPTDQAMQALWRSAWGEPGRERWAPILERSLCFVCAWHAEQLVGFVNVAWDGGVHASIFDTCVHRAFQRRGVATEMLRLAAGEARARGAAWLHVDFGPELTEFYRRSGFRHTAAGLLDLTRGP